VFRENYFSITGVIREKSVEHHLPREESRQGVKTEPRMALRSHPAHSAATGQRRASAKSAVEWRSSGTGKK
jgi:hypothetical protein